jgi:hypothetical protein
MAAQASEVSVFLLVVGAGSVGSSATELIANTFPKVYKAAALGVLNGRSAMIVDRMLMPAPQGWEWDQCGRLREWLARRVLSERWDPSLVVRVIPDIDTLRFTLAAIRRLPGGRDWIRTARKFSRLHPGALTKSQSDILNQRMRDWWNPWDDE